MKFYIRAKSEGFLGNAVMWWKADRNGYTEDINKAGKFSKEEALEICRNRKSDVAYNVDYIEKNTRARKTIIDAQYLCELNENWFH